MDIIRSNRTETITKSEAVKLFEASASGNYARIAKKYIQYIIDEDLDANNITRNIFLQGISQASVRTYKSAVNSFLKVCDQYDVLKVIEDVQLKKRDRLDHSLNSHVEVFLSEAGVRASSKETYRRALKQFIGYIEEGRPVSRKTVNDWKEDLLTDHSPYTVNIYLSAVREFLRYIIDHADEIFQDRAEGVTKELHRALKVKNATIDKTELVKDVFTKEQIKQIIDRADQKTAVIIGLMYFAGLRTVEVTRLLVEDVKTSTLKVKGKGKDQKVSVPMNDQLKGMLKPFTKGSGQLFPGLTTAQIRKAVNKVLTDLNLKEGEAKRSCHSFRHSFCTHLIEAGVPIHEVQALARHASITTTEQYLKALKKKALQTKGITNVLAV